jgi:hypothetical protein
MTTVHLNKTICLTSLRMRPAEYNTLHKYTDLNSNMVEFVVKKTIVDYVIGDKFYFEVQENDSSDEDADEETRENAAATSSRIAHQKRNAPKLFQPQDNEDSSDSRSPF